ncbi:hypothetical protein [Propionivibrio sp.]|uniref:hypothetical protein n=1 Tax=Propionivibrio sp. TaxID=2212460 RepID=UPI00262FC666|nr:hypothetical protein [Propionivibrio sp.]
MSICLAGGIALAIAALYLPFLSNPAVFDDHNLFNNLDVYDAAQVVFSRYTRTFPNFTIGFIHVLASGDLTWNRYFGAALHGSVVLSLYFLLARAIARVPDATDDARKWLPVFVCLWIALNPTAVYAAGYLIQRTIVLATLFAIVSINLYLRAQQRERNVDVLSAALFSGLSMMCKEHALLLPFATVALTPLGCEWSRAAVRRALGYLALTLPCSVWALLYRPMIDLGTSYEIYTGQVLSQLARSGGGLDFPGGVWAMSIATQLLLFWKYLFLWVVPNPQWMSADLRINFSGLWSSRWAYVGVFTSLTVFLAAAVIWLRTRAVSRIGQLSAVLLFAAISFVVELSVVRVQEPFVIYRSYLWMPAYALLLCFALSWCDARITRSGALSRRLYWGSLVLACLALFPLAQDRLRSFSSEEALWQDALLKLPRPDVPGADRIYYNVAGEAYKRKDYAEALRLSEKVIVQNPVAFQGYLAKGTSLLALRELDAASLAFDEATAHRPPPEFMGYIEFKRCGVLEARGDRSATIACLKRSARMGYEMARFRLKMAGIEDVR